MELSKEHGSDILGLTIGDKKLVVLNSSTLMKEAFNQHSFGGRPRMSALLEKCKGERLRGMLSNDGKDWLDQRKFTIKSLRELGFEKSSTMESIFKLDIIELIESFQCMVGQPISLVNKFHVPIINSFCFLITGQRYSHDDVGLLELTEGLRRVFEDSRALGLTLFYPNLKKILPESLTGKSRITRDNLAKDFATSLIESHKNALSMQIKGEEDSNSFEWEAPTNYIDTYLIKIRKTMDKSSSFYQDEGEKNLVLSILDLIGSAGTETLVQTLTWAFLYLSIYPEIQEKLYREIKNVVGTSRLPRLEHRSKMPYTEAFLLEVLRCECPLPFTALHRTTSAIKFHSYDIPVDTLIAGNLYAALHDDSVWDDPSSFDPTRFLSPDQNKLIRLDAFIPFSVGTRACIAEKFSTDQLFLFLACLVQKFRIEHSPSHEIPNPANY